MIKKTGDLNQEELLFRLLRPVGQARRQHRQMFENSDRGHKPIASIYSFAVYHGLVVAAMAYLDRRQVLRAESATSFVWAGSVQMAEVGMSQRCQEPTSRTNVAR